MPEPIELARSAAGARDPLEALRAISALRKELVDLEQAHVAAAVGEGRSWRQIAEALGVSKQAAHKRHASRVPSTPRPAPEPRQRRLLVTGQARRVVERARAEADAAGSPHVGPEHLLLGLLGDDHGTALRALQSAGVDLGRARTLLPSGEGETARRAQGERVRISAEARRALEDSLREAVRLGDSHLGVEHLLLALLREPGGPAARLVSELGVEPKRVSARVHQLVGSPG